MNTKNNKAEELTHGGISIGQSVEHIEMPDRYFGEVESFAEGGTIVYVRRPDEDDRVWSTGTKYVRPKVAE